MIQSSPEMNAVPKSAAVFATRMCLLLLLMSSALLVTGCSTVSPDDRAFYYSGWVNPNAATPGQ
jgi:hypothetical protein